MKYTESELVKYAFSQLEDADLLRQMDEDLFQNPDGEVGTFLQEIEERTRKAFDLDWGKIAHHRYLEVSDNANEAGDESKVNKYEQEINDYVDEVQRMMLEGDYEKALIIAQRAQNRALVLFGDKHSMFATALSMVGSVYSDQFRWEEAITIYEAVVEIERENLSRHGVVLSTGLMMLGNAYRELGRYDEAETVLHEGLSLLQKLDDLGSFQHFNILYAQSAIACDLGLFTQAQRISEEAMQIGKAIELDESLIFAMQENLLAIALRELGEYDKAEFHLNHALELCELNQQSQKMFHGILQNNLGVLFWKTNRFSEAEAILNKAINTLLSLELSPVRVMAINNIALIYFAQEEFGRVEEALEMAMEYAAEIPQIQNYIVGVLRANYSVMLQLNGRFEEAEEVAEAALVDLTGYKADMVLENLNKIRQQNRNGVPLAL